MKLNRIVLSGLLAGAVSLQLHADARRFGYVYEPETLPQGAWEIESWTTLRAGRSSAVGQADFHRWDLRQEIEYGVTDRYTVALYVNEKGQTFRDPATGHRESEFEFKGVSLENRYNLINPVGHAIGLTLYLEGRYSGEEAELEQKIILGQRHGDWKWAVNLEHATEWEADLKEREGEVGASFGLARELGRGWSLGIEVKHHLLLPEYRVVENLALFLGPTLAVHREHWWALLSVLPQIHGWNFGGDPDGHGGLELADHEKLQVRLLIGIHL